MIYAMRRWMTLTLISCSQALMRLALLVCPAPDAAEKRHVIAAYDTATASGDVRNWRYFERVIGEQARGRE